MYCGNTEVLTEEGFKLWSDINNADLIADVDEDTLILNSFAKPLNLRVNSYTGVMYQIDNNNTSMCITPDHNILGHLVSNSESRYSEFTPHKYTAKNFGVRQSDKTLGQREARLSTAPSVRHDINPLGKLIGFYIGDGFVVDKTIGFHFKKERKLEYIVSTLNQLGLKYSCYNSSDETYNIRIYLCDTSLKIIEICGGNTKEKRIGGWHMSLYKGIFDGLKNSDGSIKRSTWTYSTSSNQLLKDFLDFAPLAGLTASMNSTMDGSHRLMVKTNNSIRINDSRTPSSKVELIEVFDRPVYQADSLSGALITRRNGKVLVSC